MPRSTSPDPPGAENCSACGVIGPSTVLYEVRGYPVARCPECGLGRTVVPSDFDPTVIYTEEYFQGGQADGYADYQGSRDSLSIGFRNVLADIEGTGVGSGSLLEIGCAYGYFLDESRHSFQVSGVELAEEAVAACRSRGLDVVRIADRQFYDQWGPFDVVVMLDVIEHLTAPDEILDELHAQMRPGAILVLTTGDFHALVARAMGKRWRLMTPPQHLWFFTADAMNRMLETHGFRVRSLTHPTKRVPVGLIAYQLARYVGLQRHLKDRTIPGSIPVNLFDAMQVIAERV